MIEFYLEKYFVIYAEIKYYLTKKDIGYLNHRSYILLYRFITERNIYKKYHSVQKIKI